MDRRGFADIAYHFLIDPEGLIYEGREINVRGAHVQGFNTGSVGIVLVGNFSETEPTRSQVDSLANLVGYLRYAYEIRYLAGHKDYPGQGQDGTECPGDIPSGNGLPSGHDILQVPEPDVFDCRDFP